MYELSSQSLSHIHGGTTHDDIVVGAAANTYIFLAWENESALADAWAFGISGGLVAGMTALANGISGNTSALWGLAAGSACFQLGFVYSPGRLWNWL